MDISGADKMIAEKTSQRIVHLQESVSYLLRFASEAAGLKVPPDLIEKVTPLLRKSPETFDDANEISLWQGCDQLTQLVKPSSLESAKHSVELADWYAAEKFERQHYKTAATLQRRNVVWIRGVSLLLAVYLVVQGYVISLNTTLEDAKSLHATQEIITQQLATWSDSSNSSAKDALDEQSLNAAIKLEATLKSMERLVRWTPIAPSLGENGTIQEEGMQSVSDATTEAQQGSSIEVYARIWRDMMQGYIVPCLLGMMGAAAFVIRQTSQAIKDNRYIAASAIRDRVRVVQGATFGALAGIFVAAFDFSVAATEFSVPLAALIFGYNSEIVFRGMDAFEARFKKVSSNEQSANSKSSVPDLNAQKPS